MSYKVASFLFILFNVTMISLVFSSPLTPLSGIAIGINSASLAVNLLNLLVRSSHFN